MKRFCKFVLVFVILICIFVGLLVLACSFPSSLIKDNVASSSKTLNEEGNYKRFFIIEKFQFQGFDNYSDSLMINTAYSIDSKTPVYSAFTAKKNYIPGVTTKIEQDVVGELKSNSKYEEHSEVQELEDTVNGVGEESFEYAKYWHGYLSVLRPLLLFLDYQQIRVLLTFVLAVLAIYLTTTLAEQKGSLIATFFLMSLVFVEYFYVGLSLINSITFLIMMSASLVLVKRFKQIKDFEVFFFIIGICVGFFSLLDAPLLTILVPLTLYFVYKDEKGKDDIKELLKYLLFWGLGYFLTWMMKWVLMDIIYQRDLIKIALSQVVYRSVGKANLTIPILAICLNLLGMAIPMMINITIQTILLGKFYQNINIETRKNSRVFLIISLIPIVWYLVFSNHSINHYFFAYRILFITMFANLLWIYYMCGKSKKYSDLTRNFSKKLDKSEKS